MYAIVRLQSAIAALALSALAANVCFASVGMEALTFCLRGHRRSVGESTGADKARKNEEPIARHESQSAKASRVGHVEKGRKTRARPPANPRWNGEKGHERRATGRQSTKNVKKDQMNLVKAL